MDRTDLDLGDTFGMPVAASLAAPSAADLPAKSLDGALFPDHPALRAVMGALMCAGPGAEAAGWRCGKGCAELVVYMGLEPVRVRLLAGSAELAMREVVEITPLALSVLIVLVDRLQHLGREAVMIGSADILEAKSCHRWGEERHALERQIGLEFLRIGAITLDGDERPLFSVTPIGEDASQFVVAVDPAAKALWDAAPRRWLSWRLLDFDHRHNRGADVLAMKLGCYFSMAGVDMRPVMRNIRGVLKAVGLLGDASCHGGRLADRFEEAVLRLHERGLCTVAYRGAGKSSPLDERTKGWVTRWLEAVVVAKGRP